MLVDIKEVWNRKWSNVIITLGPTKFALDAYSVIKKKNFTKLLDLGSGDGRDTLFFLSKNFEVTALDFSSMAIERLKRNCEDEGHSNVQFVCEDISAMNFPPNSFDVIYSHLSLFYFTDAVTARIFKELHSVLKPGGHLFVRLKSSKDYLFGKGEKIEDDVYYHEGKVRHFMSKEYVAKLLQEFDKVSIEETSSLLKRIEGQHYVAHYVDAHATKSE